MQNRTVEKQKKNALNRIKQNFLTVSSTTTEISDFVLKESSTDNSNSDAVISEAGELFDGTPLPQISKSVTIYQLKNLGGKCSLHEVRNTQMVKKNVLSVPWHFTSMQQCMQNTALKTRSKQQGPVPPQRQTAMGIALALAAPFHNLYLHKIYLS